MKKFFTLILAIIFLTLSSNIASAKKIKKMSQLELREMETRFFETSDTMKVMKAAINTLQDSGFIIQEIEPELGYIRARKTFKQKHTNKGRVLGYSLYLAAATAYTVFSYGSTAYTMYNPTMRITNELRDKTVVVDSNVDIEKFLLSANNQSSKAVTETKFDVAASGEAKDDDDNTPTFDIGNFIVENCVLNILNGSYKDIAFKDVKATLSLDKNSVLNMYSNRFEIAEGHSSAKVNCDLKKHKYSLVLGIKDVNSDIIATTLLALPREITGKASGIIALNTDDSLKMNGSIKFNIKDGTIQKVGLVEYILKFAALFRNPLVMISPSTFGDLVNIPEGNFDKINGTLELKDNNVERMMIKSSAPQLSSFIIGRYELESGDASLRIYTKFSNNNKGFAGFLRNISLNSLANRIPLSARNDSNYYAAEISQLPPIDAEEKDCQIFLTKVDGDVQHNNFISSLKKIQ